MEKTLYIHIGRPKVASSAIQNFLLMNRAILLKNYSTLYPKTGEMDLASHKFALVFLHEFSDASNLKTITPASIYSELVDEIKEANAVKTVLSSENFFFVDPFKLPLKLMKKYRFKIICYIRRQDDVLISSYIQEIKDNLIPFGTSFESYTSDALRMNLLDYYPILNSWARVFGKENIIVRVYEKAQMKGNIYRDIINAIDIPWDDGFKTPDKRLNPSPNLDVLEYICMINQFDANETVYRSLKRPLLDISEKCEASDGLFNKQVFSLSQRKSVLDRYYESNAMIAKEFLDRSDGQLFYENLADETYEATEYPGISVQRLSKITAGLFLNQAKINFKLSKRLKVSDKKIRQLEQELNQIKNRKIIGNKKLRSWLSIFNRGRGVVL
jgi:hypothetical protein